MVKTCVNHYALIFSFLYTAMAKITKKILFFDTETTWLPTDMSHSWMPKDTEPNIVQLAWTWWTYTFDEAWKLVMHMEDKFDILFKSINPIPAKLTSIHWISDEMVKDCEYCYWSRQFLQFITWTKEADILCGHNLSFDLNMVKLETRRMFPSYDFWRRHQDSLQKTMDTMTATVDLCKLPSKWWWQYKNPKLSELHQFLFNEDFDNAHNAFADIEATQRCFFHLLEKNVFTISQ